MQHRKNIRFSPLPFVALSARLLAMSFLISACGFLAWGQEDTQITTITLEEVNIEEVLGGNSTEDERINDYLAARKLLTASVNSLEDDRLEARRFLDSAKVPFENLQFGNIGGDSLIQGVDTTFDRAITAISNGSMDDLAIQVSVIEGGLQRLLYESALVSIGEGDFETGKNRISYIAEDLDLTTEQRDAIAQASNQGELVSQLELGVVESMNNYNQRVRELTAGGDNNNIAAAYLNLANAYSDYILVQDSPNVPQETGATFNRAITSLWQGSDELATDLDTLGEQIDVFRAQASNLSAASGALATDTAAVPLTVPVNPIIVNPVETDTSDNTDGATGVEIIAAPVTVPTTEANVGIVVPNVETTPVDTATTSALSVPIVSTGSSGAANVLVTPVTVSTEETSTEETSTTTETTTPSESAATTDTTTEVTTLATVPATTLVAPPTTVSELVTVSTTETSATGRSDLMEQYRISARNSLKNYNLPARTVDDLVELYASNGFSDIDDALDRLYSDAARAVVAVETGSQTDAKQSINAFQQNYQDYLQPVVVERNLKAHTMTSNLLKSMEASPALRLQDTALLVGEVNALKNVADGKPSSAIHNFLVQVGSFWLGWPRVIVMILAALASIIPLYLLNRAFGVNNPNWRWIGFALFLLLAPVIFEGIALLLSTIAGMFNLPYLDVLSPYSIFQNTLSQIVWIILTLLAIVFATIGLYGICVQFGVLGGRNNRATVISQSDTRITTGDMGADTVVDWDEDF